MTAPMIPIITAIPSGCPIAGERLYIYEQTISPIPKAVPRLVRAGNWYFLKKRRKLLSSASASIAGLSERNVVTIPSDAAPGIPKSGFMSGWRSLFASETKPNSESSAETEPMMTQTAVR